MEREESIEVVILCGGRGTRLREETEYRPKPMVEIGEYPILCHIMEIYSRYGFNNFILTLGYKGEVIKEYFLNYDYLINDFTIDFKESKKITSYTQNSKNWKITLANTGLETLTGGRIKRIEKYIQGDTFMVTYGDGVGNIQIDELLEFHFKMGKIATVTAVRPISRFGELYFENNLAIEFKEKPQVKQGWINGGFFVFQKKVFDYLDGNLSLESKPLEQLAKERQLAVYPHRGFWHCMDTYRDVEILNEMWRSGKAPWKF